MTSTAGLKRRQVLVHTLEDFHGVARITAMAAPSKPRYMKTGSDINYFQKNEKMLAIVVNNFRKNG